MTTPLSKNLIDGLKPLGLGLAVLAAVALPALARPADATLASPAQESGLVAPTAPRVHYLFLADDQSAKTDAASKDQAAKDAKSDAKNPADANASASDKASGKQSTPKKASKKGGTTRPVCGSK